MGVRIRQHVNPLAKRFETLTAKLPEDADDRIIDVEIGCADAQFLFELAAKDPSRLYVGLEIREPLVDEVNARATEITIPVVALLCHANNHLKLLFRDHEAERVFINFPDPWFKRRHIKRRMVTQQLINDAAEILAPNGVMFFQSDIERMAKEVLTFVERSPQLTNSVGEKALFTDPNPFGARSWREQYCEKNGRPVWRVMARRNDG